MQGHQTGHAEFRTADGQHRRVEVDIVKLEVTGFTETQPRDTQEPEQTVVDPGA